MDTEAYVYKWTEKSTGKWYIGSRSKHGCHVNDGYVCSSKTVKQKINTNPDDWYREILNTGTPQEMVDLETELLVEHDVKNNPMSYNEHDNTGGFKNRLGTTATDKTRKKMSKTRTGKKRPDQSTFMKNNNPMYDKKIAEKFSTEMQKNNPMYNEESRKKQAETRRKNGLSAGDNNPARTHKSTCIHCKKTMAKGLINRWHDDNCKQRPINNK